MVECDLSILSFNMAFTIISKQMMPLLGTQRTRIAVSAALSKHAPALLERSLAWLEDYPT